MLKKLFLAAFGFILISCAQERTDVYKALPYVNEILSGSVPGLGALKNKSVTERSRTICVLGDSASCACMCDTLLVVDKFDNASGASTPDLLPDFAGEAVACITNATGYGYGDFMVERDTVGLRELSVNMLLSAVDTMTHLSLYDKDGLGHKKPAKILIFTDPWVSLYGKIDIDTLISVTSCPTSVIVPVRCAFDDVLKNCSKAPSIAVISDADSSVFPVYSELYAKLCAAKSLKGGSCAVFAASDTVSLRSCMDTYMESGIYPALNAMIFDCYGRDFQEMHQEYFRMSSVMHKEYIHYGHLFESDFRFVYALNSAVERCHSIMRDRNIFSHNIARPYALHYWMVGDSDDKTSISIVECIR